MSRRESLHSHLEAHFKLEHLHVLDESSMHNVPAGAESHFKIVLVSPEFSEMRLLARQRLVHDLLKDEMQSIHALSLQLYTPDEWTERESKCIASPACKGANKN
jgi:BolA protein